MAWIQENNEELCKSLARKQHEHKNKTTRPEAPRRQATQEGYLPADMFQNWDQDNLSGKISEHDGGMKEEVKAMMIEAANFSRRLGDLYKRL